MERKTIKEISDAILEYVITGHLDAGKKRYLLNEVTSHEITAAASNISKTYKPKDFTPVQRKLLFDLVGQIALCAASRIGAVKSEEQND